MTQNFIAGAYSCTHNAKALGQSAEGWTLSHQFFKRLVTGDFYADAPQDAVYRGREQFLEGRLIEALEAGIADLVEPYAANLLMGQVGTLDIRGAGGVTPAPYAKQFVMTAVAGTPAANDGPATITFPLTILAEGFPVTVLYAPDLREIPFRARIYPSDSGVFGTTT